ncbi:MAG: RpiB/LacA/LacB family sugar-phosphate isomerase [Patescibacteria group bacterium]
MKQPTIYLGADHAGFHLKTSIREHLESRGFSVEDLGAHELDEADDYPEYAAAVAEAVRNHPGSLGVLTCGNAEGICIAANKFDDIRAGIGFSIEAAKTTRADDNANILCLPGRIDTQDDPLTILDAFLTTDFSAAPRHVRRLQQVEDLETQTQDTVEIIPTVLVQSEEEFLRRITFQPLRNLAPLWQIDILNDSLVSGRAWAEPKIVATASSIPALELHLMIEDPLSTIVQWKQHVPTLHRAIVHAEISQNLPSVIKAIKSLDLEVGIALNPETPLNQIEELADQINVLLIMGVHPGKNAQVFLGSKITQKIYEAKHKFPKLKIAVDGGINEENVALIVKSGARRLAVGSALWGKPNPEEAFQNLYSVVLSQLK